MNKQKNITIDFTKWKNQTFSESLGVDMVYVYSPINVKIGNEFSSSFFITTAHAEGLQVSDLTYFYMNDYDYDTNLKGKDNNLLNLNELCHAVFKKIDDENLYDNFEYDLSDREYLKVAKKYFINDYFVIFQFLTNIFKYCDEYDSFTDDIDGNSMADFKYGVNLRIINAIFKAKEKHKGFYDKYVTIENNMYAKHLINEYGESDFLIKLEKEQYKSFQNKVFAGVDIKENKKISKI